MHVDMLKFDVNEAEKLFRKYQIHKHYQNPMDAEIERIAGLIVKGKAVIRGAGSVALAGLDEKEKLPKLAIGRADQPWCMLKTWHGGRAAMWSGLSWTNGNTARSRIFEFPPETFPGLRIGPDFKALTPHIPPDVRPKRGIENYTIVWEADWHYEPPVDPILCRRIGNSDFFIVLAQWDLSPIERFVMQNRMGRR